jgi:hypothetical protein
VVVVSRDYPAAVSMVQRVTLETLAQRVEALERAMIMRPVAARQKDWRRVKGMFGNSEFMREVDAAGRAIREAERAETERDESAE